MIDDNLPALLGLLQHEREDTIGAAPILLRPVKVILPHNHGEAFIAITQATVFDNSGRQLYHSDVLIVNKSRIGWIFPREPVSHGEDESSNQAE